MLEATVRSPHGEPQRQTERRAQHSQKHRRLQATTTIFAAARASRKGHGKLKGQRLSARAIDLTVRRLASAADLDASAHTLRHTCLTRLVRAGHDLVLVAELAGHTRLETTRRYSLPTDADRQAAMDTLHLDY